MNQTQWAVALLQRLNIRPTPGAVGALVGWAHAEGGHWNNSARFNPLNTTQPAPGAGNTGTQGNIKVYRNWNQGLNATVQTLRNGRYGNILQALQSGNAHAVGQAVAQSPWGTGTLAETVIDRTPPVKNFNASGRFPSASAGSKGGGTRTIPGQDRSGERRSLLLNYLLGNSGGDLLNTVTKISQLKDTPARSVKVTQGVSNGLGAAPHGGIYNRKNLGRTDQGVDVTGHGAIPALGDAVVTRVSPQGSGSGWPGAGGGGGAMIVYRLTRGPNRGKYVYVAENLDPVRGLRVGQRVRGGQVIGRARGAFPFTEQGWAANSSGRTLAQATTGYKEGQVTPAGQSFKKYLGL